jgi:hypothetical protein
MRIRILGGIGTVWGGAILVSGLLKGVSEGSGAYAAGSTAGLIFGALLFLVGTYYLIKGGKKKEGK